MKRNFPLSILGLLTAASLAFSQPSEVPLSLDPATIPPLAPTEGGWPQPIMGAYPPPLRPWFVSAEVEYILWFLQREQLDGSLASSDAQLQTTTFSGDFGRDTARRPLSGGSFTLGLWHADYDPVIDPSHRLALYGVEFNGFFLGERSLSFLSGAAPTLLRPFFNLNAGDSNVFVVAFPGLAIGQLSGRGHFDLWGAETNVFLNVFSNPPSQTFRAGLLAGFRYLSLDTGIRIDQDTRFNQNLAPEFAPFLPFAGDRLQVFDSFETENKYYGAQVGLRAAMLFGCAEFATDLKYSMGNTRQKLAIEGGQLLNDTAFAGGLLALPSNSGTRVRNRFTQVPEANFDLRIHLTENLTFNIGYTFLYFSRVIRSANQIDRVIDVTQIPNFPGGAPAVPTGLGRPAALFRESGLLVQGLNFGMTFSW